MTEEEYVDTRMSEMRKFCIENNRRLTSRSKPELQEVFRAEFSGEAVKEDCEVLLNRVQENTRRKTYISASKAYGQEHAFLRCVTDKEMAENIKNYAMYKGLSVSSLILKLLREAMEKDNWE